LTPARLLLRWLIGLALVVHVLWACAALWIDGPFQSEGQGEGQGFGAIALVAIFLVLAALPAIFIRPFARSAGVTFLLAALVSGWWLTLKPSNDRDWQSDVSRLAQATIDGDNLTIQNVRRFTYGIDGEVVERWSTETYRLSELVGFDIFFSFWGPQAYGHTLASWEFSDGRHLAISIETRKEAHETYSPVRSFFRQFELYYVVSQESDLVGVRAAHRNEDLELYRVYTPNDGDRLMLLDYIEELNNLALNPRWYNTLTENCTTTIWRHARSVGSSFPLDWRILANGYVLELAHELGTVNTSLPVEELRARSMVSDKARALIAAGVDDMEFSKGLRVDLPARSTGLAGQASTNPQR